MFSFAKSRLSGKVLFFIFIFLSSFLHATIINVPGDQPTIQAGINAATNSDTVLVQPGTYVENINFNGKLITLGSLFLTTQDTTYISSTTIDGNQNGGVVRFVNEEDTTAVLCGFTITNGSANAGGGIFCYISSPSLESLAISDNSATFGGGIRCYDSSSPSLQNVTITGNFAYQGGGICCTDNSSPSLVNVTITGNNAWYGGGIYCINSSPSLINSILWNDSPQEIYIESGSVTATYSDIQGGWTGTGNINADPLFVDPGNGDYHLQSTSPCIDAGDPAFPLDPDGTVCDMGAYYFYQPPDADFAADITNGYVPLTVNFTDLSTGVIDEWYWDFGDGNNSSLQDPANEYYNRGSYTVSLTVTDVNDSTDTETKVDYITVLNSAPILQNPLIDFSFDEDTVDSSIDLNIVFDDADLPYGDVLSFSNSGNTNINVSIVSGIVTLIPDPDWYGYEDITFTATDDSLASVSDEVRVTIDPVNDAPVINSYYPSYSPVTIDETESQLFWVSASDIDGDPLSYQWYVDDVSQTGQTDSIYTYTTDYTSAGTYMIKCIVDDGVAERRFDFSRVDKANNINLDSENNRATDYQEWQLIVNDVDQNIVVNDIQPAPGPVTIDEMDTIDFFIDAYDPDGNPLEYSWKLDGVEESTVSTYDFTTDYTSAGLYLVSLDVTDNFSDNSLYYEWNVTVNDVDQEIVVNDIQPPPGTITTDEMDTIDFYFSGYDPDGNPLEYSWELDGVGVSTDSTYLFETDYTSAGEYVVTLEVTDNFGTRSISGNVSRNTLNYSWDVTVNDVDQPIVVDELIPPEGDITIDEGDVINFSIDAYDPDGNNLEYSWQVEGVEVSTTNSFDFITDENSAGEYEVTLFVTDNFGTRDELNFLWNVTVNNVSGSGEVLIPVITKLFQNHPNPFNPITNIQFDIKENETGVLSIYNTKGQFIESHQFEAGQHNFSWNAENQSSGVYFYKLQTESFTEIRKMILLK